MIKNGFVISATGVSGIRYKRQVELSTALSDTEKKNALQGLEFQTLDTTGTVWPERLKLLNEIGINISEKEDNRNFGIAKCLGLNTEKSVDLEIMFEAIEKKISDKTLLKI